MELSVLSTKRDVRTKTMNTKMRERGVRCSDWWAALARCWDTPRRWVPWRTVVTVAIAPPIPHTEIIHFLLAMQWEPSRRFTAVRSPGVIQMLLLSGEYPSNSSRVCLA